MPSNFLSFLRILTQSVLTTNKSNTLRYEVGSQRNYACNLFKVTRLITVRTGIQIQADWIQKPCSNYYAVLLHVQLLKDLWCWDHPGKSNAVIIPECQTLSKLSCRFLSYSANSCLLSTYLRYFAMSQELVVCTYKSLQAGIKLSRKSR